MIFLDSIKLASRLHSLLLALRWLEHSSMTIDRKTWSLSGPGRSSTHLAQFRAQHSSLCSAICSISVFVGSTVREEKHRRLLGKRQLHLHSGVPPLCSDHQRRTRQAVLLTLRVNLAFFFCLLRKVLWSRNHP